MVTYEAIRQWCGTCGQSQANQLRRHRPRPGDNWRCDEVVLAIHGQRHDLWRAVDQDGHVLDILVPSRRHTRAAKTFVKKLRKALPYVPRVLITDQLKSDAATGEVMSGVEHRQHRSRENRCEHLHRPTRARERRLQRCKSPGHAQRLLPAYGPIAQHFRPRRQLLSASAYRQAMSHRFESWAEITGTERAA